MYRSPEVVVKHVLVCLLLITTSYSHLHAQDTSVPATSNYLEQPLERAASPPPARAESNRSTPATERGESTPWTDLLVKLLLGIAAIIAAIYGLSHLLRQRGMGPSPGGLIRSCTQHPLGPNRNLHIVQVGSRYFLLGVCEGSISRVAELTDPDTLRHLRSEAGTDGVVDRDEAGGFASLLSRFLGTPFHAHREAPFERHVDSLQQKLEELRQEPGDTTP